jgi:CHAT domain-containing protein
MEDEGAMPEAVLVGLKFDASINLACHAILDTREPLRSGLYLDNDRLELPEIMKKSLPRAQLAFLTACQMSADNESLSEKAIQLALAAGVSGCSRDNVVNP